MPFPEFAGLRLPSPRLLGFLLLAFLLLGCLGAPPSTPSPSPSATSSLQPLPLEGAYGDASYENTRRAVPGFPELTRLNGTLAGLPVFADSRDPELETLYTLRDLAGDVGSYYAWKKKSSSAVSPSCTKADVSFAGPELPSDMQLSQRYRLVFPLRYSRGTCKGFESIDSVNVTLHDGKKFLGLATLRFPEQTQAEFSWLADVDGPRNVTATISSLQPQDVSNDGRALVLNVSPLGFFPSQEVRPVSVDRDLHYARAFYVANPIEVKSVEVYARKLEDRPSGDFSFQIRPANLYGNVSSTIEVKAQRGLVVLPSSLQPFRVSLDVPTRLQPGKYWFVVQSTSGSFELGAFETPGPLNESQRTPGASFLLGEEWGPAPLQSYFKLSGLPVK